MEMILDKNFGGNKTKLRRLQADEAHKTLGVYMKPSGTNVAQREYMTQQAAYWNTQVKISPLT